MVQDNKRREALSYQQSFYLSTCMNAMLRDVFHGFYCKEITELQTYCFIGAYMNFAVNLINHPESKWEVFVDYNIDIAECFGKNSKYQLDEIEGLNNLGFGHGMIFFISEVIANEWQKRGGFFAVRYQYYISARELFLSDFSRESGELFFNDIKEIIKC